MRVLLGQLAPVPGDVATNLARLEAAVRAAPSDIAVFPELFLSGYRVGDRFHTIALSEEDGPTGSLKALAKSTGVTIAVGAPRRSPERRGELENVVLVVSPGGRVDVQVKRYLPTFGPFEEGVQFTPTDTSRPLPVGRVPVGFAICYDTFFPEVARGLALAGAELLVVVSASPVTSRRLFDRLLPARAIENGTPVVYVNRVGVEDGVVFGGGTGAWDVRGEPIDGETVGVAGLAGDERLLRVEVDPAEAARYRPFRPVLRDIASRPAPPDPP